MDTENDRTENNKIDDLPETTSEEAESVKGGARANTIGGALSSDLRGNTIGGALGSDSLTGKE